MLAILTVCLKRNINSHRNTRIVKFALQKLRNTQTDFLSKTRVSARVFTVSGLTDTVY